MVDKKFSKTVIVNILSKFYYLLSSEIRQIFSFYWQINFKCVLLQRISVLCICPYCVTLEPRSFFFLFHPLVSRNWSCEKFLPLTAGDACSQIGQSLSTRQRQSIVNSIIIGVLFSRSGLKLLSFSIKSPLAILRGNARDQSGEHSYNIFFVLFWTINVCNNLSKYQLVFFSFKYKISKM